MYFHVFCRVSGGARGPPKIWAPGFWVVIWRVLGLGGGTTGGGDRASIHRRNVESRTPGHISSYQGLNVLEHLKQEATNLRFTSALDRVASQPGGPPQGGAGGLCIYRKRAQRLAATVLFFVLVCEPLAQASIS